METGDAAAADLKIELVQPTLYFSMYDATS